MNSLSGLIQRLLRGPELIVTSQETALSLARLGGKVENIPQVPVGEGLDRLFAMRRAEAESIADQLPECPSLEAPLLHLYDEIYQAFIFGLNGTAIILSGVLVEFAVKYASYCREVGGKVEFDSEKWKEFEERLTLGPAIDRAKRNGLIAEDQAMKLHEFAREVRNSYAHFNIQKQTAGAIFRGVRVRNIDTGEEETKDIPTSALPALQILAKAKLDTQKALPLFLFADGVVRHLHPVDEPER